LALVQREGAFDRPRRWPDLARAGAGPLSRFADLVDGEAHEELQAALRHAETIGRPPGEAAFLTRRETALGRTIRAKQRGAKPKANERDESGELSDLPVAVVDQVASGSPQIYFVHTDHLARPAKMTDASQNLVWDVIYAPFGAVSYVNQAPENVDIRFPGQWFQLESGLAYNWHRHYDATLGRYVQPDPIAFTGGVNVYGYVGGNPLAYGDIDGRFAFLIVLGEEAIEVAVPIGLRWLATRVPIIGAVLALSSDTSTRRSCKCKRKIFVRASVAGEAALHIIDAQLEGYPGPLTYVGSSPARRQAAIAASGLPPLPDFERDEYPPAWALEGGAGASVRYVPWLDNRRGGGEYAKGLKGVDIPCEITVSVVP
jgi:RHS repeat-associated protein